jgi:hypothetical protein
MRNGMLIQEVDTLCAEGFSDVLLCFAANIEDTLILAGAHPGKDYSRADLMQMAQPYVVEWFKDRDSALRKAEFQWPCKTLIHA